MMKIRFIFGICCILFAGLAVGQSDSSRIEITTINTAEEAIERVMQYSGFADKGRFVRTSENIETLLYEGTPNDIPLVKNKQYGSQIWKIELDGVEFITGDEKPTDKPQRKRDFTFWLNASSGKLLRLYSGLPDTLISKIKRKPYYNYYEKTFLNNAHTTHHDFPDSMPILSFFDVVKTAISQPFDRGEITVYFVNYSRYQSEIAPVWLIDIGGASPELKGGSREDYNINHLRKPIDSRNGGMLISIYYTTPEWWLEESIINDKE